MDRQQIEALWTPLHWLTVLEAHGSYTAAARRLGVSKAAISQRITELERAAGIALVRRTTRSVQLTEAGARLVEDSHTAFEQIAASFIGVRNLASAPAGRLRVTAPVAFARQQLVHRIPQFIKLYPSVRVELEMTDEMRSLARDGFDLALRHTSAPPETHVAWPLAHTRSLLVASRAYLRRMGNPEAPAALEHHQCLVYPRGRPRTTWSLQRRARSRGARDLAVVRVSGPFAANNSEALRDAAADGLGIALVPDFSAQSALISGKLVQVLPEWEPVESFGDHLYAVRPYAAHVPRSVAAFVEFLKTEFAEGFAVGDPS